MADLGYLREAQPPRGTPTYYMTNVSRKLHENEKSLTQGGGHRVRSANIIKSKEQNGNGAAKAKFGEN